MATYTKLLLHGDGSDTSTTIPDTSGEAHAVTCVGTAQIDTAQKVFGTGSILLDGNSDYLTTPDSADWVFGSGDFTIDFWVRFAALPTDGNSSCFYNQSAGVGNDNIVEFRVQNASGAYNFRFRHYAGGYNINITNDSPGLLVDTWYHIALTKASNVYRMFQGGTQFGADQTDDTAIPDYSSVVSIGVYDYTTGKDAYHNGWIDEFRISKGIARWTSNFTPPTAAYSDYVETNLLEFKDSTTTTDSQTKTRGVVLNLNDSISSSDSKTQKLGYRKIYLDSITLADLLTISKVQRLSLSDRVILSDFITKVFQYKRIFNDSTTLFDILSTRLTLTRSFQENTTLSDLIQKAIGKSFYEDITLTDSIYLLKQLLRIIEDSMVLTDSITKDLVKAPLQDTLELLDMFEKVMKVSVSPQDTISLNEKDFDITYTDRDIIEISADPQIQAGTHGQFLSLQYVTDYPKLRWVDGRGLKLFKGKQFTMNSGSMINFIYDSANNVWQETSRMQDQYHIDGEG